MRQSAVVAVQEAPIVKRTLFNVPLTAAEHAALIAWSKTRGKPLTVLFRAAMQRYLHAHGAFDISLTELKPQGRPRKP